MRKRRLLLRRKQLRIEERSVSNGGQYFVRPIERIPCLFTPVVAVNSDNDEKRQACATVSDCLDASLRKRNGEND